MASRTALHRPARTPDPEDVAALYRQLRKGFEDGKNEPGAAGFYYGEYEMRRHDTTGAAKGEHLLLRGYWLLSGYVLRASRAFARQLAALPLTLLLVLVLVTFGLLIRDPAPVDDRAFLIASTGLMGKAVGNTELHADHGQC
ncbi:hypothetical protein ABTY00_05530 [Streptomyces microflavus]|uniref:hypothetical protein n=1 Tax=Streptomyces microflavus TaxID=1919 RepID=UPI003320C54F